MEGCEQLAEEHGFSLKMMGLEELLGMEGGSGSCHIL